MTEQMNKQDNLDGDVCLKMEIDKMRWMARMAGVGLWETALEAKWREVSVLNSHGFFLFSLHRWFSNLAAHWNHWGGF